MDVSRAQLSNLGTEIVLDDPDSDFRLRVAMFDSERPAIRSLMVESRGSAEISSAVLAALPVRQIAGVSASALLGGGDEARYRMLAQPLPEGMRSWPPDHYDRVWEVARWARRTGREGGEAGTVAEFWEVCPRTARRWIARAALSRRQ